MIEIVKDMSILTSDVYLAIADLENINVFTGFLQHLIRKIICTVLVVD